MMQTPIGEIQFTNLIFTHDPTAPRRLMLAAHFDSKWFPTAPQDGFVGATDSAAPCAMLLDLAEAMTPLLATRPEAEFGEEQERTTLQLVFLDGEEAFHDWTATDSIYGARWVSRIAPLAANRQTPGGAVGLDVSLGDAEKAV